MRKRAAIYARVSTGDQHVETQLLDLREMAKQRGYEIAHEYTDVISGSKAKRPALDRLLADARRHRFDIVFVVAFDRIARNVRHFLDVLDELNHLGMEFVSKRENIDTSGPLGRAMLTIVGAISELERSLIVERVRAGMRRAKLEGRRIGRAPLDIDRAQVVADRRAGMSLTAVAKKYRVSRATVCRLVNESTRPPNQNSRSCSGAVQSQYFTLFRYGLDRLICDFQDYFRFGDNPPGAPARAFEFCGVHGIRAVVESATKSAVGSITGS